MSLRDGPLLITLITVEDRHFRGAEKLALNSCWSRNDAGQVLVTRRAHTPRLTQTHTDTQAHSRDDTQQSHLQTPCSNTGHGYDIIGREPKLRFAIPQRP
jgi:hypothetical protein